MRVRARSGALVIRVILNYIVNMTWSVERASLRKASRRSLGRVRGNGSRRLEVVGILVAVLIAMATALVFALNAPARFPCAPYSDLVARIHGGR
jgi:uncharacterized membrane protein